MIHELSISSVETGTRLEWRAEGLLPLYQVVYRRLLNDINSGWVVVRALNPKTTIFIDPFKLPKDKAYAYEVIQYNEYQKNMGSAMVEYAG